MIIGLGVDITELARISSLYTRYQEKFSTRILTEAEQKLLPLQAVPYLASRFAAKEAAVKALGTGFSQGIGLHSIALLSDALGKPELVFYDAAFARFQELGAVRSHVSLSHGRDYAVATVLLES